MPSARRLRASLISSLIDAAPPLRVAVVDSLERTMPVIRTRNAGYLSCPVHRYPTKVPAFGKSAGQSIDVMTSLPFVAMRIAVFTQRLPRIVDSDRQPSTQRRISKHFVQNPPRLLLTLPLL